MGRTDLPRPLGAASLRVMQACIDKLARAFPGLKWEFYPSEDEYIGSRKGLTVSVRHEPPDPSVTSAGPWHARAHLFTKSIELYSERVCFEAEVVVAVNKAMAQIQAEVAEAAKLLDDEEE